MEPHPFMRRSCESRHVASFLSSGLWGLGDSHSREIEMRGLSKLIYAGLLVAGALFAAPQLASAQDSWNGTAGVGAGQTSCNGRACPNEGTTRYRDPDFRKLNDDRWRNRRSGGGGHVYRDRDHGWRDGDRRWSRHYSHRRGADVYIDLYVPSYRYAEPRYVEPRYAPRRVIRLSDAHVNWCYNRYKSYRERDNTFNPGKGRPRQQCYSPYS